MGEWLEDLPPESDLLEDTAPEDEIDQEAYDAAIRANRGEVALGLPVAMEFDQQEYDRVLRQERRGTRPPDLRESMDPEVRCDTCTHFDSGLCALYTFPVEPEDVCDSWDAAD